MIFHSYVKLPEGIYIYYIDMYIYIYIEVYMVYPLVNKLVDPDCITIFEGKLILQPRKMPGSILIYQRVVCIYIYIHREIYRGIYIYMFLYTDREREREREIWRYIDINGDIDINHQYMSTRILLEIFL